MSELLIERSSLKRRASRLLPNMTESQEDLEQNRSIRRLYLSVISIVKWRDIIIGLDKPGGL